MPVGKTALISNYILSWQVHLLLMGMIKSVSHSFSATGMKTVFEYIYLST